MSDAIIPGRYYDGQNVLGCPATLITSGTRVSLVGEQVSQQHAQRLVRVSPRTGAGARFVLLPDGGQFQCDDRDSLNALPPEVRSEGPAAWLEKRWSVALAALAATVALLAAAYLFLLPMAAQKVAEHISPQTERALGDEAVSWMDRNEWFTSSELEPQVQYRLLGRFAQMVKGLPQERYYTLMFRASAAFGANAFAFPGGTIVITDDMVNAAADDDEILAVLAHEIGHVERRHASRRILHDSAIAIVTTGLTADAASLGTAAAGFPIMLSQMKFSREFETEADDYAFGLLRQHKLSPASYADLMERLDADVEPDEESTAFLSTHPMTRERVARARQAAATVAPALKARP